jgi:hypothetical protein
MSGFASDWLALREPYDHAARAKPLLAALAAWAAPRDRLEVVDLGSGTGSNLRATSLHLGAAQSWTLVEHDSRLIEAGTVALEALPADVTARYSRYDLAGDLAAAIPPDTNLVTAAAFADLVSAAWLDRLVAIVGARRTALYVALTYDGGWRWRPGDIFDVVVKRLFDAHQETDKGFGSALGPAAVTALCDRLQPLGGRLLVASSDWQLGYRDRAIQAALLEGYVQAAGELAPDQADETADWAAQRRTHLDAGRSTLRVGHQDLLWLPD